MSEEERGCDEMIRESEIGDELEKAHIIERLMNPPDDSEAMKLDDELKQTRVALAAVKREREELNAEIAKNNLEKKILAAKLETMMLQLEAIIKNLRGEEESLFDEEWRNIPKKEK